MSFGIAIRPSQCRTSCLRIAALHPLLTRGCSPLDTSSTRLQAKRDVPTARMSTQAAAATGAGGGAGLPTADAFPTLVSPEWLHQRLGNPSLKVLDATWYLPSAGKDAVAEHRAERIPGAHFFGESTLSGRWPHHGCVKIVSSCCSVGKGGDRGAKPSGLAALGAAWLCRDTACLA